MALAVVTKEINAPADKVWGTLSEFHGIERYLNAITSSTMEGEGVGAVRTSKLQDGRELIETLMSCDDASKTLTYTIGNGALPIKDYLGKVVVSGNGEKCTIEWSSEWEAVGMPEAAIKGLIEGLYNMGIAGLEAMHKK